MNIINTGTASVETINVFDDWESSNTFDLEDMETIKIFDPEFSS